MSTTSHFPATQQDIARLKQTAIDAVNDLSSTAVVHASKAKSQFRDLTGHVREESGDQIDQVRSKLGDLMVVSRDYVSENPFTCIGAALAVGFLIGLTRRSSSTN
jgi:ElaB/YqjD/DUF883 family membrane-anchored ribosome-binding protein